ncbi:MAG: helix-hairpin-helix domain-containing protein [Anaerolineae bacterium]|nr:helix-hairpin-helix domain-containing protein [Anaerolineae bacterium]NUQ02642.1 helix-hairpin-helix domain-containing protein [Anaerolineae bacterium]
MLIRSSLDPIEKIALMGDVTSDEPAGDIPVQERRPQRYQSTSLEECIANVSTPKGKKPVLKTMMTTACERNCFYCPFRAGRGKTQRVTIRPEEMAKAFDQLQRAGKVDGLFLSSGIVRGGVTAQDRILDTVDIIRSRQAYRGYVHLKLMPGAETDQIRRALELADRVSINLEGPTSERLKALAPKKDLDGELLKTLRTAHRLRQTMPGKRASLVTQFVVGAVGDTDLELLSLSSHLYRQMHLSRIYYSGFNPILDTPLENVQKADPLREHRLYQASFLLRDYGWDVEDLNFVGGGFLNLEVDPKRAWAETHLRCQPIEINRASREQLMRVPGIGSKGAEAILRARRNGHLDSLDDLRKIGVVGAERAAEFITLSGKRPERQMRLF